MTAEQMIDIALTRHQWELIAECLEDSGEGHAFGLATIIRIYLPPA